MVKHPLWKIILHLYLVDDAKQFFHPARLFINCLFIHQNSSVGVRLINQKPKLYNNLAFLHRRNTQN